MIKYPSARTRLVETLSALADSDYQRRVWGERRYPHPDYYDDFAVNINQLYDDSTVAEDPHGNIGFTLRNEEEARAIKSLIDVLDPLYDSIPPGADDATVIAMPEWQTVIAAARQALRVFSEPDPAT